MLAGDDARSLPLLVREAGLHGTKLVDGVALGGHVELTKLTTLVL